jgi:mRNA interferase MazF
MKPGDVVLIRFPQTDLEAGKLRPALIIAIAPGRHSDLLLALISSRTHQAVPDFDEIIELSDSDFSDTSLKVRSVVRLARLASVESTVISARLGSISSKRLQKIRKRLSDWLKEETPPQTKS